MAAIVGVRFKNAGKLYYFDPGRLWPVAGDFVIVETARGLEYGQVITGVRQVDDDLIASPLKQVVRVATPQDARHAADNEAFEKDAFKICQRKIEEHKLDMKLVGVEETFDNTKILFYFTANGRVDFRSLVKDLASVFHTRIELRQIGVRDEAKMLGGLGPCGRPICCGSFLGDFQPVSIKMAKEQNLSLNPTKISGVCGRLMCCLKFEEDHYEATRKKMPKLGKEAETPEGVGTVTDLNILKETVTVRLTKGDTTELKTFPVEEIKWQKPQQSPENKPKNQETRSKRGKANRPAISSNLDEPTPIPAEDPEIPAELPVEEEMEPLEQDNDWRKAVEEALRASEEKN